MSVFHTGFFSPAVCGKLPGAKFQIGEKQNRKPDSGKISFRKDRNPVIYNVETPDGIVPSCDKAQAFLRYSDTNISAGTCFEGEGYRTVCIGFPLEVITEDSQIESLIKDIMKFLDK